MPLFASIRQRFPSWREIYVVFLTILFPVNFWSLIYFFRELPSYMLRMQAWDIIGVLSYSQAVVLLDSLLLLTIVIILAIIIPRKIFRDHFLAVGFILSATVTIGAMSLPNWDLLSKSFSVLENPWTAWGWSLLLIFLLFFLSYKIVRNPAFERGFRNFIDKLTVLSNAYLLFSVLSIMIIIIRNLGLR